MVERDGKLEHMVVIELNESVVTIQELLKYLPMPHKQSWPAMAQNRVANRAYLLNWESVEREAVEVSLSEIYMFFVGEQVY